MYYFFLGAIPLPVTPSSLNIKTPSKNQTVTLMNDGEINILKQPGLREISFEFLLPQNKYPFMNPYALAQEYTASVYIPLLNTLNGINVGASLLNMDIYAIKPPFQFIVTRMSPSGKILFFTNIRCQIEELEFDEDAANHGLDVMCKITLKEFKDYDIKSLAIGKAEAGVALASAGVAATSLYVESTNRSTSTKSTPTKYTVKEGDTLWNICKEQLGDGQKYKEIAELNNLEDPDKIQIGQVLRLK